MRSCWLNDTFVPEDQAHVSIFDRGLLFGDGVYEVAAVLNGRLLDADLHLARLERSLAAIEIPMTMTSVQWLAVMQQLAESNEIREGLVYLQVTRGVAERDFPFPAQITPTMFAYARPKPITLDANASGVRVLSVPDIRWARRDIKSTSLLAQVLAKQTARAAGAFEALMHEDGEITEGGASTFWIVHNGTIVTRPLSNAILAGITRDIILLLAREAGVTVVERTFTLDEVMTADECFLSSATSFVLPVTKVDDHVISNGQPGAITLSLRTAYFARATRLTTTVAS